MRPGGGACCARHSRSACVTRRSSHQVAARRPGQQTGLVRRRRQRAGCGGGTRDDGDGAYQGEAERRRAEQPPPVVGAVGADRPGHVVGEGVGNGQPPVGTAEDALPLLLALLGQRRHDERPGSAWRHARRFGDSGGVPARIEREDDGDPRRRSEPVERAWCHRVEPARHRAQHRSGQPLVERGLALVAASHPCGRGDDEATGEVGVAGQLVGEPEHRGRAGQDAGRGGSLPLPQRHIEEVTSTENVSASSGRRSSGPGNPARPEPPSPPRPSCRRSGGRRPSCCRPRRRPSRPRCSW